MTKGNKIYNESNPKADVNADNVVIFLIHLNDKSIPIRQEITFPSGTPTILQLDYDTKVEILSFTRHVIISSPLGNTMFDDTTRLPALVSTFNNKFEIETLGLEIDVVD